MLNKYPALGAALCACGSIPAYGRNQFHEYNGVKEFGIGYYCAKCEKTVGVIGPKDFALYHWNAKHERDSMALNAPIGFRFGALEIETRWMGGSDKWGHDAVLFENDELRDRDFNVDSNIKNVNIINPMNGKTASISFGKRRVGYVYLTYSTRFNPTINVNRLVINANPSGFKEIEKLEEIGYAKKTKSYWD